jgi:hypothetical protein
MFVISPVRFVISPVRLIMHTECLSSMSYCWPSVNSLLCFERRELCCVPNCVLSNRFRLKLRLVRAQKCFVMFIIPTVLCIARLDSARPTLDSAAGANEVSWHNTVFLCCFGPLEHYLIHNVASRQGPCDETLYPSKCIFDHLAAYGHPLCMHNGFNGAGSRDLSNNTSFEEIRPSV